MRKSARQRIRRLALLCIIALSVFAMLFPGAGSLPVRAISSNIVISEFRTRGLNGGNDEFIELYNLSGSDVDISGWKINGSNSTGSSSTRLTVAAGTILNPGCYYLATNSSATGYSGSVPGNQTYTTGIADDGGIALLDSSNVVIDQAGMSAGSAYKEGTVLAPLTTNANRSYERKPGGGSGNGQDTDNNSNDFQLLAPSDPQSLSSGCLPYTPTSTPTPSNTPTDTDTPTSTNTPTETGAPTETQTPIQTETPSATPAPTDTATNTPTPTPTFTPTVITPGAVVINEVMWMGTTADANDEWIELYNTRSFPIDLTGWTLTFGSKTINLGSTPDAVAAIIPAGGYFLLERTDDTTVSDIPYDQRYTGALVNAGTIITLRDSSSIVIDTANGDGGPWPAGGATLRASMERIDPAAPDSDGNWTTNDGINRNGLDVGGNPIRGTPKQPNSTTYPTATPTSTATLTTTATPTASPTAFPARAIAINEVMWMGTTADANDEWIELYNTTGSDIPLTNWTLSIDDGILPEDTVINLSGVIPAGGYFLLERTSIDTVIDEPAPPCVGQTYAGSLANDGRILNLRDPSFTSIDTANGNGGPWPAGLESPRGSMERINTGPDTDGNWSANYGHVVNGHDADGNPIRGTPCQPNSNLVPTPTPTAFVRNTTVRLNEVLPNPGPSEWWIEYGLTHTPEEYVELYNVGSEPVDIGYWMLDDGPGGSDPYVIPPGWMIYPGDYWFMYTKGLGLSFNDDGDSARLLYPDGSVVDEVSWNAQMKDDYSISRDVGGVGTWRFDWRPTPGMGNAPHAVGSRLGLKPTPVVAGIRVARTWDDGAWVTIVGRVTGPFPLFGTRVIYVQDDSGRGIAVYLGKGTWPPMQVGQAITAAGYLRTRNGERELYVKNAWLFSLGEVGPAPTPIPVRTGDVGDDTEGTLVAVSGTVVRLEANAFWIDDGSGPARIFFRSSTGVDRPKLRRGQLWSATGIVGEYTTRTSKAKGHRIMIRFATDVFRVGGEGVVDDLTPTATSLPEESVTPTFIPEETGTPTPTPEP